MATEVKKTSRQADADAAAVHEQKHRERRDTMAKRQSDLMTRRDDLLSERETVRQERRGHYADDRSAEAKKATDRLATIDLELASVTEELQAVNDRVDELSKDHSAIFHAHMTAQRAVVREPCEEALLAVNAAFRQLEAAWVIAGHLARELQAKGDEWGQFELEAITGDLTNRSYIMPENIYALRLPTFPRPE